MTYMTEPWFPDLWSRIEWRESRGNPYARSPVGARGPAQIMPATAADPGYGLQPLGPGEIDDPEKNRAFGQRYFDQMLTKFGGDHERALVAYNVGPGFAEKWDGRRESLPAETQGYLREIVDGSGIEGGPFKQGPRPQLSAAGTQMAGAAGQPGQAVPRSTAPMGYGSPLEIAMAPMGTGPSVEIPVSPNYSEHPKGLQGYQPNMGIEYEPPGPLAGEMIRGPASAFNATNAPSGLNMQIPEPQIGAQIGVNAGAMAPGPTQAPTGASGAGLGAAVSGTGPSPSAPVGAPGGGSFDSLLSAVSSLLGGAGDIAGGGEEKGGGLPEMRPMPQIGQQQEGLGGLGSLTGNPFGGNPFGR